MLRNTILTGGLCLVLASCGGGGGGSNETGSSLSNGAKIFVTSRKHVADFKNDPLLQGTTAVTKADYFCNTDPIKPNSSNYKALIVDSVNRSPINNIDWVLKPNTTYYRPYDDIKIGVTTNTSIFPTLYADLTNSIVDNDTFAISDPATVPNGVWTGIYNASTFAPSSEANCFNWSMTANSDFYYGAIGSMNSKTVYAFSNIGGVGCNYKLSLYCVEQP